MKWLLRSPPTLYLDTVGVRMAHRVLCVVVHVCVLDGGDSSRVIVIVLLGRRWGKGEPRLGLLRSVGLARVQANIVKGDAFTFIIVDWGEVCNGVGG